LCKETTEILRQLRSLSHVEWPFLATERMLISVLQGWHGLADSGLNELVITNRCSHHCGSGTDTFVTVACRIDSYKFSFLPRIVIVWKLYPAHPVPNHLLSYSRSHSANHQLFLPVAAEPRHSGSNGWISANFLLGSVAGCWTSCSPSRMLLLAWWRGPESMIALHLWCDSSTGFQFVRNWSSRRHFWCSLFLWLSCSAPGRLLQGNVCQYCSFPPAISQFVSAVSSMDKHILRRQEFCHLLNHLHGTVCLFNCYT